MSYRWTALGIVTLAAVAFRMAQTPSIDRAEVERIITVLAADEMRGRATFSPEIERAAAIIATEFAAAGLEPHPGEDDYQQRFHMRRVTVTDAAVRVNGETVSPDRYAASLSEASVRWESPADVQVETVGAEDDLFGAFSRIRRITGDILVVVADTHAVRFARLAGFLNRANTVSELGGTNVLWLLASDPVEEFDVDILANVETRSLANVAGMIHGRRSDEIVLFSAHYDHIGVRPAVDGDSIANGANDDASGTTAVIALARYFAALGQPERTLMFVTFTAEEMGGFGSRYFSNRVDPDQIVAMFNIEMIGKPATDGPNSAWITGFERSDFGAILQRAVEGTPYRFYADPYPDQNLFYRSDNATLARLGVPAHSISTTPIDLDPDYHQVSDEVSTLDLDHMTNTIAAIAAGALTIVSGMETPTRVHTTQVN